MSLFSTHKHVFVIIKLLRNSNDRKIWPLKSMGSGRLVSISEQILCCCPSGDVTLKLLNPDQKSVHWFENSYAIQQVVLWVWGGTGWIKGRSYDGDLETITQWVLEAEHFEVTNYHRDPQCYCVSWDHFTVTWWNKHYYRFEQHVLSYKQVKLTSEMMSALWAAGTQIIYGLLIYAMFMRVNNNK